MKTVENYIKQNNFQLLSGNLSPAEAIFQLQTYYYGVIEDENKNPVALIVVEDLENAAKQGASSLLDTKANFPPTIIVGYLVKMQDLASSKLLRVLTKEARGALAIGNNEKVVGILSVEAVGEYLGSGEDQQHGRTMGDSGAVNDTGLAGQHQLPKCSVQCAECGFVNQLDFLDRRRLPICQNKGTNVPSHKLKLI